VPAEEVLVEPHLGVHVHALELDEHERVPPFAGHGQPPLVPAEPGREEAARGAGRRRRVAVELDAPVVREVDRAPVRVVDGAVPDPLGELPEAEAPAVIQTVPVHSDLESLVGRLRAPGSAHIHQIGIVVANRDEAVARYSALLGYPSWRQDSLGRDDVVRMTLRGQDAVYSMRLAFAGDAPEIELIEPVDGHSLYSEWLAERGEGLHHLAVVVDSLDATIAALETAGYPNIQSGHGFAPTGKGGYAYFDTTHVLGFILEAVEMP
jgi:methylmalonyl-CoA/ethylmalonyl-CoA epimerase